VLASRFSAEILAVNGFPVEACGIGSWLNGDVLSRASAAVLECLFLG
jgi:hypothetical protein